MLEFDPQPAPARLPSHLASPFRSGAPDPLAVRAAAALQARLARGEWPELAGPDGGKMFGVLVVADANGRVGSLWGFSGTLGGRWDVEGFVPPLFDVDALARFWPAGLDDLARIEQDYREAAGQRSGGQLELEAVRAEHALAQAQLREHLRERRTARQVARDRGDDPEPLDRQSQTDRADRKRLSADQREREQALTTTLAPLEGRVRDLADQRSNRSKQLLAALRDGYVIRNARGQTRTLASLFPDREPPGGAGDCAAPKLLAEAYRRGLRPLALAEFWWGQPTRTQARREGEYYPACRGKCGPILPFMLEGLDHEPAPVWGADSQAIADPSVVHEDPFLIVVDKPAGLLAVPGRHERLRDSVFTRLEAKFAGQWEPLVVHRLDLDTSGLMLVAKDRYTHAALQKQFALRTIHKRYDAWLEGSPRDDEGRVELALRGDLDDRPRQIHDPVLGKPALTDWRVVERRGARTRVAFVPHTGRTHQLRVHAAHPLGIGVAIVGDRLYGRADRRLLLHAERLGFDHPHTRARVELRSPAPFEDR